MYIIVHVNGHPLSAQHVNTFTCEHTRAASPREKTFVLRRYRNCVPSAAARRGEAAVRNARRIWGGGRLTARSYEPVVVCQSENTVVSSE